MLLKLYVQYCMFSAPRNNIDSILVLSAPQCDLSYSGVLHVICQYLRRHEEDILGMGRLLKFAKLLNPLRTLRNNWYDMGHPDWSSIKKRLVQVAKSRISSR